MAVPTEPEVIIYSLVWDPALMLWVAQQQA